MSPVPPPHRNDPVLTWFSIGFQVLAAFLLVLVLVRIGRERGNILAWLPFAGVSLIPLLAQGLICWLKNEPIIHIASLIASMAILAFILHDLLVPSYFLVGMLAPWPVVLLVMSCGNVVAWAVESRRRRQGGAPDQRA